MVRGECLKERLGRGRGDLECRSVKGPCTGCWQGPPGKARTGSKTPQPLPSTHTHTHTLPRNEVIECIYTLCVSFLLSQIPTHRSLN